MTKSWSVPFPESETEHDGMPVFWRFQATVEEDGIKIFALQYIAFQQDLAVVSTLVDGMKNIDTSTPDIEYNFGHNQETENWVFY
ncbi:hypothetical protein [Salmonella enterica]|uniref:hypothetical protein n=1 Tax=Salmonella enterica TaxID=28901 RepID=UPI0005C2194D|nr:hypothetical protein [Salmonella enterica]KIV48728.1 hypothetical protein TR76_02675 [Salmonella enterica subsp. enterica serovar Lubbock]